MDRTIKQQMKEYKLQLLRDKKEREQLTSTQIRTIPLMMIVRTTSI